MKLIKYIIFIALTLGLISCAEKTKADSQQKSALVQAPSSDTAKKLVVKDAQAIKQATDSAKDTPKKEADTLKQKADTATVIVKDDVVKASDSTKDTVTKVVDTSKSAVEKATTASLVHIESEAEFESKILKSTQPALVDFYADWCGPCRMLAPTIKSLATDYSGKAVVAKVNVDKFPKLSSKYGIKGIPCIILFKDGKEVDRVVGLRTIDIYKQALDKL